MDSERKKVCFVGHFSPKGNVYSEGNSIAGSRVQRQIFGANRMFYGPDYCTAIAMQTGRSWPRGYFYLPEINDDEVYFPGILNLPFVRHVWFSISLFRYLLKKKVQVCYLYNSYLFENLIVILCSRFFKAFKVVCVIQDIHTRLHPKFAYVKSLRFLLEFLSLKVAKRFDVIVPVSDAIISDFGFDPTKSIIFRGAPSQHAEVFFKDNVNALHNYAVFAGALEAHNGIDRLVHAWIEKRIEHILHVFGRGSLEASLKERCRNCPYVIFHGVVEENQVLSFVANSRWNFCLRYSSGLDERYFFPSKFFNLSYAPGLLLVNNFYGLPDDLRPNIIVLADDLSDLDFYMRGHMISSEFSDAFSRRTVIKRVYSWDNLIRSVDVMLNSSQRSS